MNYPSRAVARTARIGALGSLLATLLLGGQATTATAVPITNPAPAAVSSVVVPLDFGDICYTDLPNEAYDTLGLIDQGGPFPYPQDGGTFYNREGLLPSQPTGYYREYTVETPGSDNRGTRRIVAGESSQEDYYTSDHYASFDLVDYAC